MMRHLAIFDKEAAEAIFDGRKKIEGRFSQIKIPPFSRVSAKDVVLIKISGEEVIGQFSVDRIVYFDHPTKDEIDDIKKRYGKALSLPETFWLEHERINFVTLMFIKSATKFIVAPKIAKKDLRGWVVLG